MNSWKKVSSFVKFTTKGITPRYVPQSSIIVLNQKCIRGNRIDYSHAQFTDDTREINELKFVRKGDILINSTGIGTAGRSAFVSEVPEGFRLIVDSHILVLRCHSFFEAQCLSYALFSYEEKLMSFMTGSSGQSEFDKVVLLNLKIKLPTDLREQESIGRLMSGIDSKISLNNRINAELEAMAKTIFDYWFVQFDFPISKEQAKAMGKPKLAGKPYKTSGGKMVWSEELKREVPEGWQVTELRNYLSSNRGVSYSGKEIAGEGIPMINLNSFNTNSTYKVEGLKSFSGVYNASKVLKPFDLVMCNTQQTALDPKKDVIGKSFLVPDIFETDVVSSHHVTTISVKMDTLKYYLNSLFNTEHFHRYISGYATGTNILGLNFEGVLSYKTTIPINDLLSKYKSILAAIERKKSCSIRENQRLTELRDWLLPLLMNGQVRIRETPQSKVAVQSEARPANQYFYQTQLIAAIVNASKRNKINHGEMTLAKYTYLLDKIYGVPTYFKFDRWHLGPYPKEMKKVVNNRKFFKIQNNEVTVVPQKKEYNYQFQPQVENAIGELTSIFKKNSGKERSRQTELIATVCKVVEDIQSTDLKAVRESMKKWSIKLENSKFKHKAEKFSEEETNAALKFIAKQGWVDALLIKDNR